MTSANLTELGWQIVAPVAAPTAVASTVAGSLGNGNYQYEVTFVNAWGETLPGPASSAVNPNPSTSIALSAIPVGASGTLSRNIYRTTAGGTSFLLLATIANNTATTYVDSAADGSLGAAVPTYSTALSRGILTGYQIFTQPQVLTTAATVVATSSSPPIIGSQNNIISTCPIGGQVSLLPINANIVGLVLQIRNNGANPCLILPASGQTINGGASLALSVGATVILSATGATAWTNF